GGGAFGSDQILVDEGGDAGRVRIGAQVDVEDGRVAAAVGAAAVRAERGWVVVVEREIPEGDLHGGRLIGVAGQVRRSEVVEHEAHPVAVGEEQIERVAQ